MKIMNFFHFLWFHHVRIPKNSSLHSTGRRFHPSSEVIVWEDGYAGWFQKYCFWSYSVCPRRLVSSRCWGRCLFVCMCFSAPRENGRHAKFAIPSTKNTYFSRSKSMQNWQKPRKMHAKNEARTKVTLQKRFFMILPPFWSSQGSLKWPKKSQKRSLKRRSKKGS